MANTSLNNHQSETNSDNAALGFFRTGKALEEMGDLKNALLKYERGLGEAMVLQDHTAYKTIQTAYHQLAFQLED